MVKPGRISRQVFLIFVALILGLISALPTLAHSHVYWPQQEGCYAKPGELVKWRYFWGHPFEMLISDAQPPKFFMFTPKQKEEDLAAKEITLKDQESGQDRKAFELEYKPPAPGDYYLCLESPPYFIDFAASVLRRRANSSESELMETTTPTSCMIAAL